MCDSLVQYFQCKKCLTKEFC